MKAELFADFFVLSAESLKETRIMRNNELHVVPTAEGWQITPAPENNQDETFDTRTEAVVAALHAAEIENLDVIVHSDDGTIVNMPLTSDISGKSAAA